MSFFSRLRKPSTRMDARTFVAQREPQDTVIDVRTSGEYASGHLDGALNVNLNAPDFPDRIRALALDGTIGADRPVYLYCRSGNRSGVAAGILRRMGFEEAYNIGGYDALRAAGARVRKG